MGWIDGWTFYPVNKNQPILHEAPTLHDPDRQNIRELWTDFLLAVKSGGKPICDIEIGHRSTSMSLLGMLSLKLGRSLTWDGDRELVVGDEEANLQLSRDYRGDWVYPA